LVHFARSLNCFNESFNYLHPKVAAVAIDELLFVDCQHLSNVRNEIERLLIGNAVLQDLLAEEILHLGVVTFAKKLQETQHSHAASDALSLCLVYKEHLVYIFFVMIVLPFLPMIHALIYCKKVLVLLWLLMMIMNMVFA
jgi:hypothetical protein